MAIESQALSVYLPHFAVLWTHIDELERISDTTGYNEREKIVHSYSLCRGGVLEFASSDMKP